MRQSLPARSAATETEMIDFRLSYDLQSISQNQHDHQKEEQDLKIDYEPNKLKEMPAQIDRLRSQLMLRAL